MSERRGLIAFDQEMANPGEAVGDRNPEQRPHVMAGAESDDENSQSKQSSTSMHYATAAARVLREIEGKEVLVSGEPFVFRRISHLELPSALRLPAEDSP